MARKQCWWSTDSKSKKESEGEKHIQSSPLQPFVDWLWMRRPLESMRYSLGSKLLPQSVNVTFCVNGLTKSKYTAAGLSSTEPLKVCPHVIV